jgi:hypothetical protein
MNIHPAMRLGRLWRARILLVPPSALVPTAAADPDSARAQQIESLGSQLAILQGSPPGAARRSPGDLAGPPVGAQGAAGGAGGAIAGGAIHEPTFDLLMPIEAAGMSHPAFLSKLAAEGEFTLTGLMQALRYTPGCAHPSFLDASLTSATGARQAARRWNVAVSHARSGGLILEGRPPGWQGAIDRLHSVLDASRAYLEATMVASPPIGPVISQRALAAATPALFSRMPFGEGGRSLQIWEDAQPLSTRAVSSDVPVEAKVLLQQARTAQQKDHSIAMEICAPLGSIAGFIFFNRQQHELEPVTSWAATRAKDGMQLEISMPPKVQQHRRLCEDPHLGSHFAALSSSNLMIDSANGTALEVSRDSQAGSLNISSFASSIIRALGAWILGAIEGEIGPERLHTVRAEVYALRDAIMMGTVNWGSAVKLLGGVVPVATSGGDLSSADCIVRWGTIYGKTSDADITGAMDSVATLLYMCHVGAGNFACMDRKVDFGLKAFSRRVAGGGLLEGKRNEFYEGAFQSLAHHFHLRRTREFAPPFSIEMVFAQYATRHLTSLVQSTRLSERVEAAVSERVAQIKAATATPKAKATADAPAGAVNGAGADVQESKTAKRKRQKQASAALAAGKQPAVAAAKAAVAAVAPQPAAVGQAAQQGGGGAGGVAFTWQANSITRRIDPVNRNGAIEAFESLCTAGGIASQAQPCGFATLFTEGCKRAATCDKCKAQAVAATPVPAGAVDKIKAASSASLLAMMK